MSQEEKDNFHGNAAVGAVRAVTEEEQALTQSLEEGLEVLLGVDVPGASKCHGGTQQGPPAHGHALYGNTGASPDCPRANY